MTTHLVAFDPHHAIEAFSHIRSKLQAQRAGKRMDPGHVGLCSERLRQWYREMCVVFPSGTEALADALSEQTLCAIDFIADYNFTCLSIGMDVVDTIAPLAERHAMAVANKVGVAVMNLSVPFPRFSWPV